LLIWMGASPNWKGTDVHPAPQRIVFISASGEFKVTTSDGRIQRVSGSSGLLMEDTDERGQVIAHSQRRREVVAVYPRSF